MKISIDKLFHKIKELARKAREDLRKKGIIVPSKQDDGSVKIGRYIIQRKNTDFYRVVGIDGELMIDNLNLPQTAVVVANHLALKNYLNKEIIEKDREYGYAYFEYQLYQRAKERSLIDPDYFDVKVSKFENSGEQADFYKQQILEQFNKLKKIA